MKNIPSIGIIGVGGFAGAHHDAVIRLEAAGRGALAVTCDPDPANRADGEARFGFSRRGVALYADFESMLAAHKADLALCCVPTPIPLHAAMHRALAEAGVPCYLEKPPTLYYPEWKSMMEAERRARARTAVGFNFIVEPRRAAIRACARTGVFGKIEDIRVECIWPRAVSYYRRASWAGRGFLGDRPVLDSPLGNACSHFVFDLLNWAALDSEWGWARPSHLEAEAYRAHAIESADTWFVRGVLDCGTRIRIAVTHAAFGDSIQGETVHFSKACFSFDPYGDAHLACAGRIERIPNVHFEPVEANLRLYLDSLAGSDARPGAWLEETGPFVAFSTLAFLAARRIVSVPEAFIERRANDAGEEMLEIAGIRDAVRRFIEDGRFPSEQGAAWAQSGGSAFDRELEAPDLESRLRSIFADARTRD